MLTQDTIKELVSYDAETGGFFWLARAEHYFKSYRSYRQWNSRFEGKAAGDKHNFGKNKIYWRLSILGKRYLAHRVAWLYSYGGWPEDEIDHINGCGIDNRLENLRDVSRTENSRNMRRNASNTSGTAGVVWFKPIGKWNARIMVDGKSICLGYYSDINEAISSRKAAEKEYGFHENHGRHGPRGYILDYAK